MNRKGFLAKQLEETAKIIEWAIKLIPENRLIEIAPHKDHPKASEGMKRYFGLWPAYRLLFHLTFYEENYALPTMKHYLGEPHPDVDIIFPKMEMEDAEFEKEVKKGINLQLLIKRFHSVRKEQLEVLKKIKEEDWTEEKVKTGFGKVSLEFTTSKTIQHTLEHGDSILRNALYWKRSLDWLNKQ